MHSGRSLAWVADLVEDLVEDFVGDFVGFCGDRPFVGILSKS